MASNDFPKFWNEFQWEAEIRRDERRISGYFQELPSCLDLPGEEEMIYEKLFSQVDLMPVDGKTGALRNWEDDDSEEEWENNSPPHKLLLQLDCLAVEWNTLIVNELPTDLSAAGLGIACQYGKLLVRLSNFLDGGQQEATLKISLGKRCLADLNDLAGDLKRILQTMESLDPEVRAQQEMLGHIREQLLRELKAAREDIPF